MALFFALALAYPVARARADTPVAVRAVVVAKDIDAPIVGRLRTELTTQGFESLAVWGPPTPPSPSELASIARGAGARGVLRFDAATRTVEVWLAEPNAATPVLLDTVRWTGADDVGVAAVRAAETLHKAIFPALAPLPPLPVEGTPPVLPSALVPVAPGPLPVAPPAAPAVPPPAPAPPPPPRARFTLAIGIAAVGSPGGIGPMADVSLATAWHPAAGWAIGAFAQLPVLSATLVGPGAMPQVGATLLGAEVAHAVGHESWKVHPDVGLGAGAILLHLEGAATSTSPSAAIPSADAWMAAAVARGGLAVAVARDWRLRADAMVGVAFPEAEIEFGRVQVATWGRPFLTGGASIEFVLR